MSNTTLDTGAVYTAAQVKGGTVEQRKGVYEYGKP